MGKVFNLYFHIHYLEYVTMIYHSLYLKRPSIVGPTLDLVFLTQKKNFLSQCSTFLLSLSSWNLHCKFTFTLTSSFFILHPVIECQYWPCVTLSGSPLKHCCKFPWPRNCFILYDYKINIKYMMTSSSDFLNNRFCPLDHRCTGVWVPGLLTNVAN